MSSSYQEPSDLLKRLFLPPKNPSLTLSSDQEWMVICQEPPLPSIELLAKPEEKLAGIRFDPHLLTPSRMDYATSLTIQHLSTGEQQEMELPQNSEGIRYIRFHPSKPLFVFSSKVKNELVLDLYKCELSEHGKKWNIQKISLLEDRRMNFVNGCSYQFTSDGNSLLVKVVPENWPTEAPKEPISTGPSIQLVQKNARKAPGRTYQDLLRNQHDEAKLKYFLTTQLLCIDMADCNVKVLPQCGNGCLFQSLRCSPSGRYLLTQLTTDFSYSVPLRRFGRDIQIWDLESADTIQVESIPVDDEIPLSYDACSRHPRSFHFHSCEGHTLVFAKALDGGDPENDLVDGERDALYTQTILAADSLSLGDPVKLVGLEWRFNDIDFCESGLAMVDEYRWKDRMERKWIMETNGNKRLLWERSWEDRYKAPGSPFTRRGTRNQYFIVQPTPTSIYLRGAGASPLGDRPFLDCLDFGGEESKTTRLWRCKAPVEGELDAAKEVGGQVQTDRHDVFESLVCLLPDNDSILISRESKTTPRNYYLTKLAATEDSEIQVTQFAHPQPDLLGVTKELVHYKRKDGVDLTANLYLPPNYDNTARPTLFWAYPREFKDGKAAGQVKGSKHKFVSASWASPIHWAVKGWAIMDEFSLPVIGEGEVQPNDTFIEQIVTGATAAVEYAKSRGVCDPNRCAVGGHSYGSFMTSHLLSHTSLFAAGIGRSGAFNRTLTPMSFQSEDRSIWEAPDTYITMSPLIHVKKYSNQERVGKMLLIHGEADENSGTHPMQSERYFAALKAFGIESRLAMLPHERHSYRARESILHMAWEQETWLSSLEEKESS
jgi:dipeptidyl aminopeptidase/acylaminoacyl peptidase